jgi:hypothetical protein
MAENLHPARTGVLDGPTENTGGDRLSSGRDSGFTRATEMNGPSVAMTGYGHQCIMVE